MDRFTAVKWKLMTVKPIDRLLNWYCFNSPWHTSECKGCIMNPVSGVGVCKVELMLVGLYQWALK